MHASLQISKAMPQLYIRTSTLQQTSIQQVRNLLSITLRKRMSGRRHHQVTMQLAKRNASSKGALHGKLTIMLKRLQSTTETTVKHPLHHQHLLDTLQMEHLLNRLHPLTLRTLLSHLNLHSLRPELTLTMQTANHHLQGDSICMMAQ